MIGLMKGAEVGKLAYFGATPAHFNQQLAKNNILEVGQHVSSATAFQNWLGFKNSCSLSKALRKSLSL